MADLAVRRFLARAAVSGLSGTTAMTATSALEKRVRSKTLELPVDYDAASQYVVAAAATVLHVKPHDKLQSETLFALTHWGYGSAVASAYTALLERGLSRPQAAAAFYAMCQTMAFALFPLLGGTPPPWRWRRDVLASSLAQHLVYVTTVAVVDRAVAERLDRSVT